MRQTVESGELRVESVPLRLTRAYWASLNQRCKCCGEYLSSMDALEAAAQWGMPSATELCTHCQFKLSVVLTELLERRRRAA